MADKPQAQKDSLGQLFVDIGINGLGKTLKGLNSVAASFLLGKNAANQFAQTITAPFKKAGNSAVEIGKLSNSLATTSTEYQKFAMYLKKYKVSEGLLGDVQKMMSTLKDWQEWGGDLPEGWAYIQELLGVNIEDLSGSFEEVLGLMDEVYDKTRKMSKLDRNAVYRRLGVSDEWGYLGDQGGRAGDYYTVSTEAIERNKELAQAMSSLASTFENFTQNVLAQLAPQLEKFITAVDKWIKHIKPEEVKEKVDKGTNAVKWFFTPLDQQEEKGIVAPWKYGKNKKDLPMPPKELPTGMAADIGYMGNLPNLGGAEIPPNLSNIVQNITNNITHDITINGSNASEIANQIAGISAQDIEYSQYQISNLPGL